MLEASIPIALRGNVAVETRHGESPRGDYESVARRRCQDPKPAKEGRWWVLRYWQDEFEEGRRIRKRKRTRLAKADMPEREVRKIALEFLRPFNQGLVTLGSAANFNEFVESTYVPVVLPQMAQSTQDRYMSVIKNYLKPQFGGLCLRDVTVLSVDRYVAGLGKTNLSHESLDKIRDVLSAILSSAVRYGLLVKNPAEGIRLPHRKKGKRSKPFVTQAQFSTLLELVAEPYATMMYVAAFTGLRVSELIGLRWDDIHEHSITVDERCCRGDWGRT